MIAQAWFLLFMLSVLWGGSFLFNAIILRELSVFGVVFGRVFVGFLVLFIVVSANRKQLELRRNWKPFLVMGVLNNFIPFNLIVAGQHYVDSGLASIFNATTPFFAVVFAYVFALRDQVGINKLIGVLIGAAGVCVLFKIGSSTLDRNTLIGGTLVIGGALSYALAGIYGRRFSVIGPQIAACGMLLFAAVFSFPLAIYFDRESVMSLSWLGFGAIIGIGLLSTSLAYILYFRILAIAGPVNLLLVTLLIPVSATLLGHFILGETVTTTEWIGMAVIAVGLLVVDGRIMARFKSRRS